VNRPEEPSTGASDERLLADFLAGDQESFNALVRKYTAELYRFVARFVRSPALADDIVQESFVQVYQAAAGFDPARRFRPWLFTIAANKARDHFRERGRRREVPLGGAGSADDAAEVTYLDFLADDSVDAQDALEAEESRLAVRAIIARMPDHLREILVLGYYHQFPYKEIADILSIPLGTVKSRLHAAVGHFAVAYRKAQKEGRLTSYGAPNRSDAV
jgi:RNA polymerase sigma-70 factor (ECF subfamily)